MQPTLNLIRDGGTVRHLEPQVMDLLAFLATTGGRVVSKDEIIDAVWEGRFIAETTLTRSIADLRRALDDNQRCPQYIETIAKRGYRLVATIADAGRRPVAGGAQNAEAAETQEPRGDRGPVVLPFAKPADAERGEGVLTSPRIADRLASARRSRFVGREAEIEIFRAALLADEPPFVVLHVTGAGGVGKTTLLQEFARVARRGRPRGGTHRRPQHRTVGGGSARRAEPGARRRAREPVSGDRTMAGRRRVARRHVRASGIAR